MAQLYEKCDTIENNTLDFKLGFKGRLTPLSQRKYNAISYHHLCILLLYTIKRITYL